MVAVPPTIAQRFVRKCKSDAFPSVKVTCNIEFGISKNKMISLISGDVMYKKLKCICKRKLEMELKSRSKI